ncbi:MAG: ABC transporter ATP-binding protein [Saccharofermentanales bacterium]|jgi:ATP-binding cassette subfamily B protein
MLFKSVARGLFELIKKCPLYTLWLMVFELMAALALPLSLKYLSEMIDGLEKVRLATPAILRYVTLGLLIVLIDYWSRKLRLCLSHRFGHKINLEWMIKCRWVPYRCYEDAETLNLLNLAEKATSGKFTEVFEQSLVFMGSIIRLLGLIPVFRQASIYLPVFYVVIVLAIVFLDFKAISMMNEMFQGQSASERRFKYCEQELSDRYTLAFLATVRGLDVFRKKVDALAKDLASERLDTTVKAQRYSVTSHLLILIWFIGSLVLLTRSVFLGVINIGLFVASVSALSSALDISEQLSVSWSALGENAFYLEKYFSWLDIENDAFELANEAGENGQTAVGEIASTAHDIRPNHRVETIEFRDVSFAYPGTTKEILKKLNLFIQGDERVALVGKNGCGKSTLIKLLLGLYQPTEGEIFINHRPLYEYTRRDLAGLFSAVFQDYARFDLPLETNIHFDQQGASAKRVAEVLGQVGLEPLIPEMHRELGKMENGALDLSGGQWQKIAIARAIYDDERFILFDEPLSAVDPIAEAALYEELVRLMDQRGCILISHRLGSAKLAERILVMDRGKIIEDGHHDELMAHEGLYAAMFYEQSRWYV